MKKLFYESMPVILWSAVIATSLMWNIQTVEQNMVSVVTNMGRAFFEEIQTTRLWNARHGGVYVKITEKTQPNPYLKVPNRDVTTLEGIKLTKINPAFMTRQIAEIAKTESSVQYHITSLKPIRPANKSDPWETRVLTGFESNAFKEFFELIPSMAKYRYMGALHVKKACMKCHEAQGYQVGDVRGGISVTIPAEEYLLAAKESKIRLSIMHLVAFLAGIIVFYLFKRYRDQQMILMDQKNSELKKERDIAEKARKETDEVNKKITESITYAKNIQTSLMPDRKDFQTFLPDSFLLWIPKDIVGGDIIFTKLTTNQFFLAVIDCTGHGVPGAFMTMLASSGLKKVVVDENQSDPAKILQSLSLFIKTSLKQDTEQTSSDDGLDAALCCINFNTKKLTYAGARLPLIVIDNNELKFIKGDKQSVGYKNSNTDFEFTNHILDIDENMFIYMATDGMGDQIGGEKGFPFGARKLRKLIEESSDKPFATQEEILLSAFHAHKGEIEQVDDVTIVGFRCPLTTHAS